MTVTESLQLVLVVITTANFVVQLLSFVVILVKMTKK